MGKGKVILTILGALVVAAIAGVVGYSYVYPTFFISSDVIVLEAFRTMRDIKTFSYGADVSFSAGDAANPIEMTLRLDGSVDRRDADSIRTSSAFSVIDFSVSDDIAAFFPFVNIIRDVRVETKNIGLDEGYVRATGIRSGITALGETPSLLSPLTTLFNVLDNRWIAVDRESVLSYQQAVYGLPLSVDDQKIFEDQQKFFTGLISGRNFIQATEKISSETLNGVDTNRYRVNVNVSEVRAYVEDVYNAFVGALTEQLADSMGTDGEPDESPLRHIDTTAITLEAFDELVATAGLDIFDFDVWIGKTDNLIYGFQKSFTVNDDQETALALRITLRDMNQPVVIEAPETSISFKNVTKVLGEFFSLETDQEISDTDGDGLSDAWEAIYTTDPENPDTDGDGFLDGEEIENGYSPLGPGVLEGT